MSSPRHQLLASKIKQTSFPPAWPVYWLLSGELSPTPLSVTEAYPVVLWRSLPGPPLSFGSYPSLLPLLHLCSLDPGTSPGDPPTQTPSYSLFSLSSLLSSQGDFFLIKIPVFISLLNLKSSNCGQVWQTQPSGSVAHQLGTLGQDSAALYLFPRLQKEDHRAPTGEV